MQEVVRYLHDRHQHYILMIDPAVAEYDYAAYNRGREMGVFLKKDNETLFRGVVWPVRDLDLRQFLLGHAKTYV
jgi:alpha-glucosidase